MGQFQIISRGGKTAATSVPPASCSLTADAVVVGGEPREGIIYLSLDIVFKKMAAMAMTAMMMATMAVTLNDYGNDGNDGNDNDATLMSGNNGNTL
jgi:hypothetical protein